MRESTSCQDTGRRTSHLPCLSWPSCLHQSDVNESMRTDSLGCVSMKQSVRVSSGFCCLSQLIVCNVTSTAISRLRSCLVEALCFKLIPTDFPYGLSLRGREKSSTKECTFSALLHNVKLWTCGGMHRNFTQRTQRTETIYNSSCSQWSLCWDYIFGVQVSLNQLHIPWQQINKQTNSESVFFNQRLTLSI